MSTLALYINVCKANREIINVEENPGSNSTIFLHICVSLLSAIVEITDKTTDPCYLSGRATGLNLASEIFEESVGVQILRITGRTLDTHLHVLFFLDGKAQSGSKKLASGSVCTLYTLLFGSGR
jgi:hypothetical protein